LFDDEDDRVEGKVIDCLIFVETVIVAVAIAALTMGRGLKEVKGREEVEEGPSVVE